MPCLHRSPRTLRPLLHEGHWRAAAEEAARLGAQQWGIPLTRITEVALIDAEHMSPEGPCYVFKLLYTDGRGQRQTGAVYMPTRKQYVSPLQMSALFDMHPA